MLLSGKTATTAATTIGAAAIIAGLAYALGAPRYWLAGLAAAVATLLIAAVAESA